MRTWSKLWGVKALKALAILVSALGVGWGCSSSDPEDATAGACNGESTCSVEQLCAVTRCGGPTARHDTNGCGRSLCVDSSGCATGEVCFLPGLLETSCVSTAEICELYEGQCGCGGTLDCSGAGICIPESEFPAEPCVVPDGCGTLRVRIEDLEYSDAYSANPPMGDLAILIEACLGEMYARQTELGCSDAKPTCRARQGCSRESVCASETCGGATARFDAEGCERPLCEQSADCEADQVCFLPALVEDACLSTLVEGCTEENGSCSCSQTADCSSSGFCIAASEVPAEPCSVPEDCSDLDHRLSLLDAGLSGAQADLKARIESCIAEMQSRREELSCQ